MFESRSRPWTEIFYHESPRRRRRFVTRVFVQFVLFLLFALLQWLIALSFFRPSDGHRLQSHGSMVILIFAVTMLLFLLFVLSAELRGMDFVNWLLTLIIVEGLTISIGYLALCLSLLHLMVGFLVVSLVLVIAILIAFIMPFDMTEDATFMFLLAFPVFILSVYAVMLVVTLKLTLWYWVYATVIACMVLPLLMYHVQCIVGASHVQVSLLDDKLASLMLFYDFSILFTLTFYLRPAATNYCPHSHSHAS